MTADVVILGASARAAAFSALRAGLRPWCADLFADRDLAERAPVVRLTGRYPASFVEILRDQAPPVPWMYTGGLENHPKLVDRLAAIRPLWGNAGEVLRRVRCPEWLAETAVRAGLPAPRVTRGVPSVPSLVKPLRGAGGQGIHFWKEGDEIGSKQYVQEFIEGDSVAAVYVAAGVRARLLGVTWQLVEGFRYRGSIGPLATSDELTAMLTALGNALASAGLRGLFGVDGVLRDGRFYPVEVNPRYTASMEVLELTTGCHLLEAHRLAFADPAALAGWQGPPRRVDRLIGKAIVFAGHDSTAPARSPGTWPEFADIPPAGEPVRAGQPILTVFASGAGWDEVRDELRRRAAAIDAWLSRGEQR